VNKDFQKTAAVCLTTTRTTTKIPMISADTTVRVSLASVRSRTTSQTAGLSFTQVAANAPFATFRCRTPNPDQDAMALSSSSSIDRGSGALAIEQHRPDPTQQTVPDSILVRQLQVTTDDETGEDRDDDATDHTPTAVSSLSCPRTYLGGLAPPFWR